VHRDERRDEQRDDHHDHPGALGELADQLDDEGHEGEHRAEPVDRGPPQPARLPLGAPVPDHAGLGQGETDEDPDGEQRDQRLRVTRETTSRTAAATARKTTP